MPWFTGTILANRYQFIFAMDQSGPNVAMDLGYYMSEVKLVKTQHQPFRKSQTGIFLILCNCIVVNKQGTVITELGPAPGRKPGKCPSLGH